MATVANGGNVENNNGFDIQFTAADGSTLLEHQIERYDPLTGEYQAWVKIPSLSTSANTVIRMYYSNAAIVSDPSTDNVWDANFAAVYHLTDDFLDKTNNNNDLANNGTANNGSGQVAKSRFFGLFDNLEAPNNASITIAGDITISTWVDINTIQAGSADNLLVSFGGTVDVSNQNQLYFLNIRDDNRLQLFWEQGAGVDELAVSTNAITIPASGYTMISATRNIATNEVTFYQDGLPLDISPATYTFDPTGGSLGLLRIGSDNQFPSSDFDGRQDEVRISNIVRSADWMLTDFNTINDPSTFYTKGPETESCNPGFNYPEYQVCASSITPSNATITGDTGGTFSSVPAGLSIDVNTGQIDISASSVGTYSVTYTIASCVIDSTVTFEIVADDNPAFSYLSSSYCTNEPNPSALVTGTLGGTFSGPPQISFLSTSSGLIDLSASTPGGPYSIKYVTPGTLCKDSMTFNITIHDGAEADFNYPTVNYCLDGSTVSPTINGTPGGNFTATPAGIAVDFTTGIINLGTSSSGLYSVLYTTNPNGCVDTFDVNLLGLDDGSFTYPQASYCHEDADPSPTINGTTGGTFSSTAGLSIVAGTGIIDLSASTPGATYTVSYLTPGPDCPVTGTFNVTIIAMGNPSFNYSQTTFCEYDTDPIPTITGSTGGTFSEPTGTLNNLNSTTGEIDLDASNVGTFWIVYTTAGLCQKSDSVQITINQVEDPSFTYPASSYCPYDTNPIGNITGTTGGTFSSTPGLQFQDNLTGEIDLSNTTPGTNYVITYTTPGPQCPDSSTLNITIYTVDDASFNYTSANYCSDEPNQIPSITSVPGGNFTTSSAINLINSTTGEIDISGSPIGGPYTIYYTTIGTDCPNIDSFDVSIGAVEDPSFSYPQISYCENALNPVATVDGTTGGVFTGNSNLIIDANSGTIDLSTSTIGGPYDITYTTPGPACLRDSIFYITIVAVDDPSFNYSSNYYCQNDINQVPTISGDPGGVFGISPTGLNIDSNTGELVISAGLTNVLFTVQYVTQGVCQDSSTFDITLDDTVSANAGPDQILDIRYETNLEAVPPVIGSGEWTVSNDSQISDITDPATYVSSIPAGQTVCYWTVTNGVCPAATDTMRIQVNDLDIPDVITPNGDGLNDLFIVPGMDEKENSIEIVNRWGQTVFFKENYLNDWDGSDMNGKLLPDDTYYFIIKIQDQGNYTGFVVIKT